MLYVSVDHLNLDMGVDRGIAKFFVDRKVPGNNAFWKNRLLYIGMGNGYISIPVYYDILCRLGVPREELLDERHVFFMERVMHHAICFERKEIGFAGQLTRIEAEIPSPVRQPDFLAELRAYLAQPASRPMGRLGTAYPALNRADVFLFVLADLPLEGASLDAALRYWYALHPIYLMMDDMYDYEQDLKEGEENVIAEFGGGIRGFEEGFRLLRRNAGILGEINPALAHYLSDMEERLVEHLPQK